MKSLYSYLALLLGFVAVLSSCKKNENRDGCTDPNADNYDPLAVYDDGSCIYSKDTIVVDGEISDTATWYRNNYYLIRGNVYVKAQAVLLVDTGTIIFGEKATNGTLIVQKGGQFRAEGTPDHPVIFTSDQPPGARSPGDWGGIIICGNGVVNYTAGSLVNNIPGTEHGGSALDENSGFLRNIRIEFAGHLTSGNNEIGALTLAAVAKSSVFDNIQVSFSGDDSFEWRGGNASYGHLISYMPFDDDFDFNNGCQAVLQFCVSLRDPQGATAPDANGIESENDASGNNNIPQTWPILCNVSIFGPLASTSGQADGNYNAAMVLRNSTKSRIFNSIFCGFPKGLLVSGSVTENNAVIGDLLVWNSVLAGCPNDYVTDQGSGFGLQAWYGNTTFNNEAYNEVSELQLTDPFNLSLPDFRPLPGSSLNSGASFNQPSLMMDPFVQQVTFRGAFGQADWTSPLADWNPQAMVY